MTVVAVMGESSGGNRWVRMHRKNIGADGRHNPEGDGESLVKVSGFHGFPFLVVGVDGVKHGVGRGGSDLGRGMWCP